MDLANASLLDEGTAAAEAMAMLFSCRSRKQKKLEVKKFFVSDLCYPQTIDILKTRATPLNIELVIGKHTDILLDDSFFGCILQYPSSYGNVIDYRDFVINTKEKEIGVIVAADLLSLTLLAPPGEWGADVVVGSTQRFGIPMGYGGPHAAFLLLTININEIFLEELLGFPKI